MLTGRKPLRPGVGVVMPERGQARDAKSPPARISRLAQVPSNPRSEFLTDPALSPFRDPPRRTAVMEIEGSPVAKNFREKLALTIPNDSDCSGDSEGIRGIVVDGVLLVAGNCGCD